MKQFILGVLIFSWGFIGVIIFTVLAALHPCSYNGIEGLRGALLGLGIRGPYIAFWILTIIGILVCLFDVWLDKNKNFKVS